MTLAEAFMARNDIQKKIDRTIEELNSVLITEEGQENPYTAISKEKVVIDLMDQLLNMNIKIDKANINNQKNLLGLRILDKKISFYKDLRNLIIHGESRKRFMRGFSTEESAVKMIKNMDQIYIGKTLEDLEIKRRNMDRQLQKKNWQIEV